MKTSDSGSGSLSGANEKEICDLTSADLPLAPPGIVGTTLERDQHSVLIDYDPKTISDESVRQAAAQFGAGGKTTFQIAASVEAKSEHPPAEAIVAEARRCELAVFDLCMDFQSISGKGASGLVKGSRISIGSIRYFQTLGGSLDDALARKLDVLQHAGKTCVLVAEVDEEAIRILGGLTIADVLRPEAPAVVQMLREASAARQHWLQISWCNNDRKAFANKCPAFLNRQCVN